MVSGQILQHGCKCCLSTGADNVTIAAHTVTLDAAGQAANNLIIQGL